MQKTLSKAKQKLSTKINQLKPIRYDIKKEKDKRESFSQMLARLTKIDQDEKPEIKNIDQEVETMLNKIKKDEQSESLKAMGLTNNLTEKAKNEEKKEPINEVMATALESYKVGSGANNPENMPYYPNEDSDPSVPDGDLYEVIDGIEDLENAVKRLEKDYQNIKDEDYYKDKIPVIKESLDLDKKEVPTLDEESLKSEVEQELKQNFDQQKESLANEVNQKIENLNLKKEEEKKKSEAKKEEIGVIYDDYKLSSENEALKRGLARSSIALLTLDNISSDKAKELVEESDNLANVLDSLEKEVSLLQLQLEQSLTNLDIEVATKINQEIKERIDEVKKRQAEAIEFNNNVNKLEAEYQIKRANSLSEAQKLEEELAKKYEGYAQKEKLDKMYDLAISYFDKLDKTTALKELMSSSELSKLLGNKFYDLYYTIMRR